MTASKEAAATPAVVLPTAVDAVAAFKAGTLSPVELTETVLERIQRFDPLIESYVDVYAEDGMTLEQLMAFTVTNE